MELIEILSNRFLARRFSIRDDDPLVKSWRAELIL
jgi:hypothetical protein